MKFGEFFLVAWCGVLASCTCARSEENEHPIALATFNVRVPVDKSPNTGAVQLPQCTFN